MKITCFFSRALHAVMSGVEKKMNVTTQRCIFSSITNNCLLKGARKLLLDGAHTLCYTGSLELYLDSKILQHRICHHYLLHLPIHQLHRTNELCYQEVTDMHICNCLPPKMSRLIIEITKLMLTCKMNLRFTYTSWLVELRTRAIWA